MRQRVAEEQVDDDDDDDDAERNEDHDCHQVLADQRHHQRSGRNELGDQQEEESDRQHDRDAERSLSGGEGG